LYLSYIYIYIYIYYRAQASEGSLFSFDRLSDEGGDAAAAAAAAATPGGGLHALRCNRAYADNGALSAIVASFDAGCAGHGRDGAVGLFHLPAPLADALLLTPLFLPPPPPPPPPPPA
jgi:hypothetical protein